MGIITIPYFCRKYNFNNPDILRHLVKHLNIQPVMGDLETRGMRFYREKDLLKLYFTFKDAFDNFEIDE
jgi:hypothetical protein